MSIYLYNSALLTPVYNGQFRLSKPKAHIFSVKLTYLIRAMKTFLRPASHTLVLLIVPCPTNDRFLSVNAISLLKNSSKNSVTCLILIIPVFALTQWSFDEVLYLLSHTQVSLP